MSSIININNNINNFIGFKLSGKGKANILNISNDYDYNGIGIKLWSNTEIAFIDTSNIYNNDYANLRFGIVSNVSIINSTTSIQVNNILTILSNNIGIGTNNPKNKLHINNICLSGSIVDINNNEFKTNIWNNNYNNIYYNNGFIGIGTVNPKSLLDFANSTIILSSNCKIGLGLINPSNALDIFNNDFNISNGFMSCSNMGIGNINPKSAADIKGDISLSGTFVNIDGTPYIFTTSNKGSWLNSSNNINNIYYNLGNVGIGTTTIQSSLYINGDIQINGNILQNNGSFLNESKWYYNSINIYNNNNNIGIGTNEPVDLLHLSLINCNVNIRLTDATTNHTSTDGFIIGLDNSENGLLWNYENSNLIFGTNNAEKIRITNNGSIGIGIINPQSLVHLSSSNSYTNIFIKFNDTTITTDNGLIIGKDSNQYGMIWNYENSSLIFKTNNRGTIGINNNGNIGIGTANSQSLLQLYKSSILSENVLLSLNDQGTTTSNIQIGKTINNDGIFWNSNNTSIIFKINDMERLRILNNGNIGIGSQNPLYPLHIFDNININGGLSINSSTAFINNTNVDDNNTSNTYLILQHAATSNDWCYIRQTGNIDNFKLSFDFYDNIDSRFAIRYIIPNVSVDIVKEVFKVDLINTYANGLILNGENKTNTILQNTSNLGMTVNNSNSISFNISQRYGIFNINNDMISINYISLSAYNGNYAYMSSGISAGINGGASEYIILKQGTATTYPYSLASYGVSMQYSIPSNNYHKFYINGAEIINIGLSSSIIYNNINILNDNNPCIYFSSFGVSAIGVASQSGSYSSSASSGDIVIRSQGGKKLILQTGNSEGHLIINNGKIGIGTNNPNSILDVQKDNITLYGNIYNLDGSLYKINTEVYSSFTSSNLILNTNIETNLTPTYTETYNKYYLYENDATITFNKSMTADILVVGAGGNGGLGYFSGGGGAGEVIYYPKYTFTPGTYYLTIGKNDYANYNLDSNQNNLKLAIYQNPTAIVNNKLFNLFAIKKPWACYFAEDFSGSTLYDTSGNNRHATTAGTITLSNSSGNGATANINYISGSTSSTINFPSGSIPSTFTILSLTRYTGGIRQRILQSDTFNFIHGHWGANRGVCYYGDNYGWITSTNSIGNVDDWLCCIGRNSGNNPGNILIDGIGSGIRTGGTGNASLTLNTGNNSTETSDWALSCILIWDQSLTDQEMILLNDIIDNYKTSGVFYSTNRNSVITSNSSDIIKAKGGGDGGTTGIFTGTKPWACYFAEDFSGSYLYDSSGNNRHATTTGTINKLSASGNGATASINYISGNTSSTVNFPLGSVPSTFTIVSLTRYTGGQRLRILQTNIGGFIHGHHGNKRGVCYYGDSYGYITLQRTVGNIDDWLCCIGKNSGNIPGNILIDGVASGIKTGGSAGNAALTINAGVSYTESSDWALSCVMIWDQALSDQDMINLNNMINNYLNYGFSIKNNFITRIPIGGGSGGGGYTSNNIIVSGATSGLKWNNSYSYANNGQSGTLLSGGNGGSALSTGYFTELITEKNLKISNGGFGISNIIFNLSTTKKNYGDGGDGGGGIGGNGVIIIKQTITNNLIATNMKTNTLNINNINNTLFNYKYIYPTCSCNLNYTDNNKYGYYLITSSTDITFKKDTIVELLVAGPGGNGGNGANSGGGGAGTIIYYPKYLFTAGVYSFMCYAAGLAILKKNTLRGYIIISRNGHAGMDNTTINNGFGSGGGGYSNIYNISLQYNIGAGSTPIAPFYNNDLNINNPYYIYVTNGTNGTSSNGGNGGSALSSGAYIETMTGTYLNIGIGGNGAIGISTPVPKTTYGSGGDGNGGLGTGGIYIIKFSIETINVFNGYQITNDNYYSKIINNNFIYNNTVQLDFYYNNGNVGIGITNPISLLHVNSNILLSGYIKNNITDLIINSPYTTTIIVGNNSNSNITFYKDKTTFSSNNVFITGNLTVSGDITVISGCNININDGGFYKLNGISLIPNSTNFSDYRIKTNIIDIDNSNASSLISAITPIIYNYIDKQERGNDTVYGFIAQQIQEVIPSAVQTIKEFIPNIYKSFHYENNQIITDEDLSILLSVNDRIKIKDDDNYYKIANITTITSNIITINTTINGCNCFIYGKEVNDFHTLDKSYIYTTNIASTQYLYDIINKQCEELQELNNIINQQELIFNDISLKVGINI